MKTLISIFILSALLFNNATASVDNISSYVFSQTMGTYTTISNTGTYISGACGSSTYGNLPIGFTFVYNGISYTQFGMCCNGWISMGPAAPNTSPVPLSTGITNNVISPFAAQLASTVAGNGIYYKTEGFAPNRTLTVEWWQYGFWFNGFDEVCFQIKLNETTNEIRFVYTTNDILSIRTIQVGLRGASNSDFNNRATTTNWSQTTAGTTNAATCTFQSGVTPPSGLTFIFTPLSVGIVKLNSGIPDKFGLYQNYPNPFNPFTKIKFSVPKNSLVSLTVYDVLGGKIKNIVNKNFEPGTYETVFDAGSLSSGIYFIKFETDDFSDIKKMVLLK